MNETDRFLKAFVEGSVSLAELMAGIETDEALQARVHNPPGNIRNTYIYNEAGSVDAWIAIQSCRGLDDPSFALNMQGFIKDFVLSPAEIKCKPTPVYKDVCDLLATVQPSWLDLDAGWISRHLLIDAGEMNKPALKKWLKERLLQLFRYAKRPPSWIQNPAWPIVDDRPLFFLGQIKLETPEFFHDDGAVYVFFNPATKETVNVIQTY